MPSTRQEVLDAAQAEDAPDVPLDHALVNDVRVSVRAGAALFALIGVSVALSAGGQGYSVLSAVVLLVAAAVFAAKAAVTALIALSRPAELLTGVRRS